jgi:tripartite-type tricarboxylate transporter receptor subunit TctC
VSQSSPVLDWKRGIHGIAVALACVGLSAAAGAQSFPSKPIRLIVPVPPGGGADFVARSYAAYLSKALGQQIVVDNRGGAAGIIAMEAVAKAPADGYTLIQTNISTISINPFIYDRLPYDAQRDFAPVSITTLNPLLLVIHPGVAARSVKELIALAKARPGQLAYGSLGSGSIQHLAGHMFGKEAGIALVHVPYKGAAPVTVDLLAAQVQMAFSGVGTVAAHVKSGRVIALAITSARRMDYFSDVPTFQESGMTTMSISLWNGILAPARTPASIIQRLNAEIRNAAAAPELNRVLSTQGTSAVSNTADEFAAFIKAERERYAVIVKDSGARAD